MTVRVFDAPPYDPGTWQAQRRQAVVDGLPAWHRERASASERVGQWFAAAFHLNRLTMQEPANPSLHLRLPQCPGAYRIESYVFWTRALLLPQLHLGKCTCWCQSRVGSCARFRPERGAAGGVVRRDAAGEDALLSLCCSAGRYAPPGSVLDAGLLGRVACVAHALALGVATGGLAPGSPLQARGVSAARGATLALHACQGAPSSAHERA